jgi:four helix bundle suffix protein
VARASLEELRLDYEDFLRQRELPMWESDHPALKRFKAKQCSSLQDVRGWVEEEKKYTDEQKKCTDKQKHTDEQGRTRTSTESRSKNQSFVSVSAGQCQSVSDSTLVANAALSLLNLSCYLLDRQLAAQAKAFEAEGGFTERLYRVRSAKRKS